MIAAYLNKKPEEIALATTFNALKVFGLVRRRDEVEFGFGGNTVTGVTDTGGCLFRRFRFVGRTGERSAIDCIEIDVDG